MKNADALEENIDKCSKCTLIVNNVLCDRNAQEVVREIDTN